MYRYNKKRWRKTQITIYSSQNILVFNYSVLSAWLGLVAAALNESKLIANHARMSTESPAKMKLNGPIVIRSVKFSSQRKIK